MNRLLLTMCLCLALAACGRVAAPVSPAGSASSSRLPAAARTLVPPGRDSARTAQPRASGHPAPAGTPGTTEANPGNHFAITFDMPACIERARPATAVVRTAKLSMIIASAAYADGENHGSLWTGSTDAQGVYSIAWTPPPGAPLGPAQIIAGVNGEDGGATARRFFTLAAPGGCS